MTHSTTRYVWLIKKKFKQQNDLIQASVCIQVARDHARRYMDLEIKDFSQWFPGRLNNVADSLSRDFYLSDEKLTTYLRSFFPSQIPSSFTIVPIPNKIVSWLISLFQRFPVNELFREEHIPPSTLLATLDQVLQINRP
jgi:hypothetical protein